MPIAPAKSLALRLKCAPAFARSLAGTYTGILTLQTLKRNGSVTILTWFNKQGLKMAKQKYQPGDFVQLKSGGPKMVVEEFFSYGSSYDCSWFAGTKHNKTRFNEMALQIYDEDNE